MKALGRLGRKRRDSSETPDATPTFAVDSCECLVDGPFALLRLTGTGMNPPASLLVDGDKPASFKPLPGPDNGVTEGVWRAAFALPTELAEPGALLWLLDGGQNMTDVCVPGPPVAPELVAVTELVEPPPPPPAPPAPVDEDDPRARKLVEAWSEAATLRDRLGDMELELSNALKEALEARTDVDPLRKRDAQLTQELAEVRAELERAKSRGREAREKAAEVETLHERGAEQLSALRAAAVKEIEELRAANAAELKAIQASGALELNAVRAALTAELEDVRAKLANAEPRLVEAIAYAERVEQEAVTLRSEVERLEAELSDARERNEATARQAELDRERLTSAAADQQRTAEELQSKLDEAKQAAKEEAKSRRRGIVRRTEDRKAAELRAELETRIAGQQKRIEHLEQEAAGFAERRDEALAESLRERVTELEEELRQYAATGDDLRVLLESEREQVSAARAEARDLKDQLATASAKRVSEDVVEPAPPVAVAENGDKKAPAQAAADPPPWSALDDELLARIEKAKLLTG